jgi:hypothetical protein
MDPINEAHVSRPGLVVVDVAAADDATVLAFQQLLAQRGRRPTAVETASWSAAAMSFWPWPVMTEDISQTRNMIRGVADHIEAIRPDLAKVG